jgi:hypothetical protein
MAHKQSLCFGNLEQVFPMTPDGLRHSPEGCLACEVKTSCLKTALTGENQMLMAAEKLDRGYQSGDISFLQRWSRKKLFYHQSREKRVNKVPQAE